MRRGYQDGTDRWARTRRVESLRPFSRARAPSGRSAWLAPDVLGRPRPALRHRQPCPVIIDCGTTISDSGQCRARAATGLASAADRRRSTPTHGEAGTRPEPIPRGDFPPCDPCRSDTPAASGAEAYVVVTILVVAAGADEYERRERSRRAQSAVGGRSQDRAATRQQRQRRLRPVGAAPRTSGSLTT